MTLIVEDGTGLPNAESFTSVSVADTYLATTTYANAWSTFTLAKKENLLRSATQQIDVCFSLNGHLLLVTQALSMPRTSLYDRNGRLVTGVPLLFQYATAELAFFLSTKNFLQDNSLINVNAVKVGPVDIDISAQARVTKNIPDNVIRMIGEYGTYRYGKNRMRSLSDG